MAGWLAVIWPSPFTTCLELALLPGATSSYSWQCSGDGSTICGENDDDSGNTWPVIWDSSDLSVTQLATLSPNQRATMCSQDGAVLAGSSVANFDVPRWVSFGNSGSLLLPATPYNMAALSSSLRSISENGSTTVGTCITMSTPNGAPTYWNGTTPTTLPLAPTLAGAPPFTAGTLVSCAYDGVSVQVGNCTGNAGLQGGSWYRSGTCYPLSGPVAGQSVSPSVLFCDRTGGVIWGIWPAPSGEDYTNVPAYWDDLLTVTATVDGVDYYGTAHAMDGLVGGAVPRAPVWAADNVVVAVGQDFAADGVGHAVKWTGTAIADLGILASDNDAWANMCDGAGSVVAGGGYGLDDNKHALYWDAANILHQLPVGAGASQSEALGISRDGTLIFGVAFGEVGTVGTGGSGPPSEPWPPAFSAIFYPQPGKGR